MYLVILSSSAPISPRLTVACVGKNAGVRVYGRGGAPSWHSAEMWGGGRLHPVLAIIEKGGKWRKYPNFWKKSMEFFNFSKNVLLFQSWRFVEDSEYEAKPWKVGNFCNVQVIFRIINGFHRIVCNGFCIIKIYTDLPLLGWCFLPCNHSNSKLAMLWWVHHSTHVHLLDQ